MNSFHKKFVTNLFLDTDSVCNINKLAVAIANVVSENNDNLCLLNEVIKKEYDEGVKKDLKTLCQDRRSPKITAYYEYVMHNFSDHEFKVQFKMRKATVQALVNFLAKYINPGNIPLEKKVLVFLLFMMNDYSFNDVGRFFDLHKSTVSYIFYEIASCLTEQRYQFISWPSAEDQHITRIKVNSRFKFPNCVGFIDTCRLQVSSKRNKDRYNVIILQAVCDELLMFMDVHVGEIGTRKKSRVYKESSLSNKLRNFVEFGNHILGDSEYKLKKNLITPFTSEEVLTSEEMKFNEIHWKTRSYIGHAFELLKDRVKKLNNIDFVKAASVNILIYSACVLHNHILMYEGCPEVKEEAIISEDGVSISNDIVKTAEEKRQFLCNYVNYIDTHNTCD